MAARGKKKACLRNAESQTWSLAILGWINHPLGLKGNDPYGVPRSPVKTTGDPLMILRAVCRVLILTLLSISATFSQNLFGIVADEQGNSLSSVNVSIRTLRRHATTDQQGKYAFHNISPGTYTVEFSVVGFKTELEAISISTGDVEHNVILVASPLEFRPVTVTANSLPTDVLDSPQPVSVIEGRDLDQRRGQSIMQSIDGMPGVSFTLAGPLSMKPVIRGLGAQRVIVAENGIRHESQQWDDDQTPELDVLDVDRIEILRGPNSVLFGSDALGGVVNIISADPLSLSDLSSALSGNLIANGFSNNRQGAGSLSFFGKDGNLVYKSQLGLRHAANITTPAGALGNTGESEFNGKVMAGMVKDWGNLGLEYSHFGQRAQIYPDPREISGAEATPYQKVSHDKVAISFDKSLSSAKIEAHGMWQRDQESEYDAAESSLPNVDLVLQSLILDVKAHHDPIGQLFGTLGGSVEGQRNDTRGVEALIPAFSQINAAIFLHEELLLSSFTVSGGMRYDVRQLHVEENDELGVSNQTRTYSAVTGVLGAVWHASDQLVVASSLGRGWRAPIAEELFINGVDQGGMRYKIGAPDLTSEASLNVDLSVRYISSKVKSELSVFHNRVNNYIYLKSTGMQDSASGLIAYVTRQANATLLGSEFDVESAITDNLMLEAVADMVAGKNEETNGWLPLIPPGRVTLGLRLQEPSALFLLNPYLYFHIKIVFDQNRVSDFETTTGGYTVFGAGFGGSLAVSSKNLRLDCTVENLFNKAYVDHLSRYKNYALNPGRNFSLRLSVPFDIMQ